MEDGIEGLWTGGVTQGPRQSEAFEVHTELEVGTRARSRSNVYVAIPSIQAPCKKVISETSYVYTPIFLTFQKEIAIA